MKGETGEGIGEREAGKAGRLREKRLMLLSSHHRTRDPGLSREYPHEYCHRYFGEERSTESI